MFQEIILKKMNEWYESDECKIHNIIRYIENKNKLRDAQIESIKMYLFFKIYCKNLSLERLFIDGYFLQNIDLDSLPISKKLNDFLVNNNAARQLYELAISNNNFKELKEEIEKNYLKLDYEKIFKDFFHNINYANYIYSLPMGAGKTYLMAAFIYIDLYFALQEPYNKTFAHNFIILAPSGLKSSIIPSLKKIKDFDATWIFPEPTASNLKEMLKFEILDAVKTDKNSNKIKNPNVAKIAQYQPYSDMFGVILLTNAEKVILNKFEVDDEQIRLNTETGDLEYKVANELRETISKIPNLAIFIDEVHHVADEEIKLNKVVGQWNNSGSVNEVIGFSGTPYLDKAETFTINEKIAIKNIDIPNTIYYYPLTAGIDNFLKKPTIIASSDNNPLNIIKEGLDKFFSTYRSINYNGVTSKIAIYCGTIKKLEEVIYPFVSEYVESIGLNANDIILKYHGGNKEYSLPKENKLEFESLNTPVSKKRIILLVEIGKEGWDCNSLTGIILSQKGDCPTKMVLQTSCRCLRQVIKGEKETALIYLNQDNEKILSNQLKQSQHATLKDFQEGTKYGTNIKRISRMKKLNIPKIEYYKMNIRYSEEIKEEAKVTRDLRKVLQNPNIKKDIIIEEKDINNNIIKTNVNDAIYGDSIDYNKWILNIIKESFGFIDYNMLKEYDKELKKIYDKITINNDTLNMTYNVKLINSLIRNAFYNKRKMKVIKEEVPESASILSINNIPSINCINTDLQYPTDNITDTILKLDNDNEEENIDLNKLTKEELIELATKHPEKLINQKNINSNDSIEIKMKDKTFHYIPYVFNQSFFEKKILIKVLQASRFNGNNLEIYYNGDHNIASFRIECYKTEEKAVKKVGKYTPDFLIIKRNKENIIEKILMIETKGNGFKDQQEFIDRRNYIENEFIKYNNKKYGYNKFDYLYIEEKLNDDEIISKINNKLKEFFKEGK